MPSASEQQTADGRHLGAAHAASTSSKSTHGSCLIATVPRSGSWLLADALHQTDLVGRPEEYFRPDYFHWWLADWRMHEPQSYTEFIRAAQDHSVSECGIFSAKLHWYQFQWLLAKLRTDPHLPSLTDAELIEWCFPRPGYVFLTRSDKARQAVSYFRAIRTDTWFVVGAESLRHGASAPQHVNAEPDFQQMRWLEDLLVRHEDNWERFFLGSHTTPLRIEYETLVSSYEATVDTVLDFVGAERPAGYVPPTPGLAKQSDELSERWLAEYLAVRDQLQPLTDDTVWDGKRKAFVPARRAGGAAPRGSGRHE